MAPIRDRRDGREGLNRQDNLPQMAVIRDLGVGQKVSSDQSDKSLAGERSPYGHRTIKRDGEADHFHFHRIDFRVMARM